MAPQQSARTDVRCRGEPSMSKDSINVPSTFGNDSIVIFWERPGFDKFCTGKPVSLREADPGEDDDLLQDLKDGFCIAMLWDDLQFHQGDDVADYVEGVLSNAYIGHHYDGLIRLRWHQPLKQLVKDTAFLETLGGTTSPPTIPLSRLVLTTCVRRTEQARDPLVPCQNAYLSIHQTGRFKGIMNRKRCHIYCGSDIVWIEERICRFRMRSDLHADINWIELNPFVVDCMESGEVVALSIYDQWRRVLDN